MLNETNTCTRIFIVALLIITRKVATTYPSYDKYIKKVIYPYNEILFGHRKRMMHAITRMNLENLFLSERIQT